MWKCKNENLDPKITWSATLNKRGEILEKCKHKRKFTLGTVKQTLVEQEPPDPT